MDAQILAAFAAILAHDNEQPADYPGEVRDAALDVALTAFEAACGGRSFSRREFVEAVYESDGCSLVLNRPEIATVVSITTPDGDAVDTTGVVVVDDEIRVPARLAQVPHTVTYTAGPASCPPDVARAVALIAADLVRDGIADDRGFAVSAEGGMVRMLTAGVSGAAFSIPEVQACMVRHRDHWAGS